MSIKYTVEDGSIFEIGSGFDTQGASETPEIIAPFPNYSIGREVISLSDGTLIGNKYSISISGKILASALSDITVPGDKQNNIQKQLIWHLKTKKPTTAKDHNIGRLEIEPYGGLANKFVFDDARLVNFNIPEQSQESSGVLYADYSFSFEAYIDSSIDNSGKSICNKISSFDESWEITENEGVGGMLSITATPSAYKVYTITHTVSATGIKSLENNTTEVRLAWKNAEDFVKTRLVSSPSSVLTSDSSGNTSRILKTFNPSIMGYSSEDDGIVGPDLTIDSYKFYGHTRVPKCDFSAGSYSIVETWTASNCQYPATLDMSVESSIDESGVVSMTVSGTINGLIGQNIVNQNLSSSKLSNAELMLQLIDNQAFNIANTYYSKLSTSERGNSSLQNIIRSKSIGRNQISGVITFSYNYNDNTVIVPNSLTSSLSINYDNEDRDVQIIAIIPIIGKASGPVMQDMGTTKEKRRTISIDAVMKKENRTSKPNIRTVLDNYKPSYSHKIQDFRESWQPITGSYNLSVEWVSYNG